MRDPDRPGQERSKRKNSEVQTLIRSTISFPIPTISRSLNTRKRIVRTMPPPEPHSTDQPMASTSTVSASESVPAILAKMQAQMQAQFSQFSKAQQAQVAQQTQFSTQLEGISNRLNRIETLNNTPSPPPPTNRSSQQPPPDPHPQHIIRLPARRFEPQLTKLSFVIVGWLTSS